MASDIRVRKITSLAEMREVERVQREVWRCSDLEIVPAMSLFPNVEVGASLIGAFDDSTLVGFAYAFLGKESGKLALHSDMLAILPSYRDQGLGLRLKLAQRIDALEKAIDLISWTFDPLQARNAHLNLTRLGGVATEFKEDFYGSTTSPLHRGGSTDRLWVQWRLQTPRVSERLERTMPAPDVHLATALLSNIGGEPQLQSLEGRSEQLRIDIPLDFHALLERDPHVAERWREVSRAAFQFALARGFVATELVRRGEVATYLLEPDFAG